MCLAIDRSRDLRQAKKGNQSGLACVASGQGKFSFGGLQGSLPRPENRQLSQEGHCLKGFFIVVGTHETFGGKCFWMGRGTSQKFGGVEAVVVLSVMSSRS